MTALRCSFLGRIPRPFRPSALPRTGARQLTRAHDLRSLRCVGSAAAVEDEKKEKARPGEKKGFVEEMRFVAMKLHTREQAPKEGKQEAPQPLTKWEPSREGYLQFLVESREVYSALEEIVSSTDRSDVAEFRNTGLERSAALEKDIAWFKEVYGLEPPKVTDDGSGRTYARLMHQLAAEDVPAFLCHFYNFYFAHTAGGRMIGTKVASMILEGRELEFYKYDGDFRPKLEAVRETLNKVASNWSREEKDHCLEETKASFSYSNNILRTIGA